MARETQSSWAGEMRCRIDALEIWNAFVSGAFVPAGVIHASSSCRATYVARGVCMYLCARLRSAACWILPLGEAEHLCVATGLLFLDGS